MEEERAFSRWIVWLWMVLGWVVVGVIWLLIAVTFTSVINVAIGWGIGGVIGGSIMMFVLRKEDPLSWGRNALWISLGWASGGTIGGALICIFGGNEGIAVIGAMIGMISGAIGSLLMIWLLKWERNPITHSITKEER